MRPFRDFVYKHLWLLTILFSNRVACVIDSEWECHCEEDQVWCHCEEPQATWQSLFVFENFPHPFTLSLSKCKIPLVPFILRQRSGMNGLFVTCYQLVNVMRLSITVGHHPQTCPKNHLHSPLRHCRDVPAERLYLGSQQSSTSCNPALPVPPDSDLRQYDMRY